VTPNAPTWGDVEDFLAADGWREIPSSERGGSRRRHVFYEKLLADGRVLQTHISHSRGKTMSPGRFSSLLRNDLEVSKDEFWACIRSGTPVDRPVLLDDPRVVEHDAWVVAVLVGELHISLAELGALSREEAEAVVHRHWARARE
jgi:hypothetical protein